MKLRHTILIVLALSLAACTQETWEEFRSKDAGFVAAFPGKPVESSHTVNTDIGPQQMHQYSVTMGQRSFSVAVAEYPTDYIAKVQPAVLLDHARDGAVANTQGKLLSELIIELNGNPGRQIKISAAGGKATIQAKFFLVKNKLYQSLVVTPVDDSFSPQVGKFLDSFNLL